MILSLATAAVGGLYVYKTVYGYFLSKNIDSFDILVVQTFGALKVGLRNNYLASQTLSQVVALNCQTVSHWPKCRFFVLSFTYKFTASNQCLLSYCKR